MFVLVRHAHAGDKKLWAGDDADRPISGRGRQQAGGLVVTLRDVAPARLVCSPYLRCRQTLAPLAGHFSLPVEDSDVLGPDGDVRELDRWLGGPRAEGAILCTHGETLNGLFAWWSRTRAWERTGHGARDLATQKGAAWVVTRPGGRTVAHYRAPLHLGPPAPVP